MLSSAFLRMILGLEVDDRNLSEDNLEKIREELGWVEEDKSKLQFFLDLIKRVRLYAEAADSIKSPNLLIKYFNEWLIKNQQSRYRMI